MSPRIAIVGAGPAGLIAAEVARAGGAEVDVYEQMPSVARKFLIAGKGGLNLTHSEEFEPFVARYREAADWVRPWLEVFGADALRQWARELGFETIVGSSGRVFPADLKAGPMLRAWVRRLRQAGVRIHVGHRWTGFVANGIELERIDGAAQIPADAVILALGGASWRKLGSDGAWVERLRECGAEVADLLPSNCGFDCDFSAHFLQRFAGQPLKSVGLSLTDARGQTHGCKGELLITATGVEGSAIYALSAPMRDTLVANDHCELLIDLLPDHSLDRVVSALSAPRGKRSFGECLRRSLNVEGVKAGLVFEAARDASTMPALTLAKLIKAISIPVRSPRPIDEAISSAGGIRREALDESLMLRVRPGTFCAGEMLDWEAPTGGYLLTASFASGVRAAHGALAYCAARRAE